MRTDGQTYWNLCSPMYTTEYNSTLAVPGRGTDNISYSLGGGTVILQEVSSSWLGKDCLTGSAKLGINSIINKE